MNLGLWLPSALNLMGKRRGEERREVRVENEEKRGVRGVAELCNYYFSFLLTNIMNRKLVSINKVSAAGTSPCSLSIDQSGMLAQ